MGVVMIVCPHSGQPIKTGITADPTSFAQTPVFFGQGYVAPSMNGSPRKPGYASPSPTRLVRLKRIASATSGVADDLEAVLRALFVSDNARAIEMSDEVRRVIWRKRVTLKKRLLMVENILRKGGVNVFADTLRTSRPAK